VTTCATRAEARREGARLDRELERLSFLEPHKLTLGAYLDRWIAHLATQAVAGHTVANYESAVKRLSRRLSRVRLAELRPLALQEWLDAQQEHYAVGTVRKDYAVLHAALAQAVDWRLLSASPMDGVKKPPPAHLEMHALSEQEAAELIESLAGSPYQVPALVAVTTGLRRGELLALKWRDISEGVISVNRALDEAHGEVTVKQPKSQAGKRRFGIMALTLDALKAHKAQQARARLADPQWHDQGLVFPAAHGSLWRPTSFSSGWARLKTGVRFHDLRHTAATALLRAGVPVDVAAKRLGHTPTMLLTTYAHVLEDADAAAVARLEESFSASFGTKSGTKPSAT
jgi:integrase